MSWGRASAAMATIDSSFLYISIAAFVAMVAGALIGLFAARRLPGHHLSDDSATAVKISAAVIVSLTSLVLALMLSAANSAFTVNSGIVKKLSSDLIQLDHLLRSYGPEADRARAHLRAYAGKKYQELFSPADRGSADGRATADLLDKLLDSVLSLSPASPRQAALSAQAMTVTANVYTERWLLWEDTGTTAPRQFIFVMILWLFLIFASFGLFAPLNGTVVASFCLSALAVTGAIFMILELGDPMRGWIQVSGEPLQRALVEIDRP